LKFVRAGVHCSVINRMIQTVPARAGVSRVSRALLKCALDTLDDS